MAKEKKTESVNAKPVVKKPVAKKKHWYMKDKFFDKRETGIKRKGKANVQAVSEEVDFKWMTVKGTLIKFEKGKAISDENVALFQVKPFNQKEFYLIQK